MEQLDNRQIELELLACEEEFKSLGFSDSELEELYSQIDGIIEKSFDKYFHDKYGIWTRMSFKRIFQIPT